MTDAAATILRLQATLDQPGLSPRAAARCQRMIERLQTPVCVAVFGLPRAGKAAVINALAEEAVLRPGAQIAPVLIRYAPQASLTLTDNNGDTSAAHADLPFAPSPTVAMAELGLPLATLTETSLMDVVADPSPQDMAAALAWAAPRCDIAIWCTQHWTAEEQAMWRDGPETLKNHALMIASSIEGTSVPSNAPAPALEPNWCTVTLDQTGLAPASAALLRQRLARMIDEARAADLDIASFFIEQHAPEPSATAAPQSNTATVVTVKPGAETPPPEARAVLSRLILHLRQTAREASAALTKNDTDSLIPRFQDALQQMLELAEAEHAFGATWPALQDTLREADDLILLLGLEGSDTQTTEAALLLAQVRQDMEFALAA
ncbi:MAG: hypothetical protein QNJ09_16120 [Paracoccaceae bacterium]|nr:hypothetical protein [Paracoccaceae bacterium]